MEAIDAETERIRRGKSRRKRLAAFYDTLIQTLQVEKEASEKE